MLAPKPWQAEIERGVTKGLSELQEEVEDGGDGSDDEGGDGSDEVPP